MKELYYVYSTWFLTAENAELAESQKSTRHKTDRLFSDGITELTKEEILKIIRYRKGNHGLTRMDTDLRKDFFTTKARRHEEFL